MTHCHVTYVDRERAHRNDVRLHLYSNNHNSSNC